MVYACAVEKNGVMFELVKIFFLHAPGKKVSMLIFCKLKGVCRSLKQ